MRSSAIVCDHDRRIADDRRSVFPHGRKRSQNILRSAIRDRLRSYGNHVSTYRNTVAKRTQHVAHNNVAICCVCMLRSFGRRGFIPSPSPLYIGHFFLSSRWPLWRRSAVISCSSMVSVRRVCEKLWVSLLMGTDFSEISLHSCCSTSCHVLKTKRPSFSQYPFFCSCLVAT